MEDNIIVRTATGKEFNIRFMGATVIGVTSVLYIEFIGYSMMDIVPVFSNPNETTSMQGLIDGTVEREFKGYTNLIEAIVLAESQNLRIALTVPIDALGD